MIVHRVRIMPLDTFSANEASDNMYRMPTVLQDQAKKCYMRGYRHILYVAQAPYSSSLHLTSAETAEEQFFMSGSIIESLKGGHSDLHIYPVYCDRFYIVKIDGKIVESLYVDDTSELRSLVNDPNRSSVVFFNLLNGLIVGSEQDRLYNGVVSYATLINVYDDPIYADQFRHHLTHLYLDDIRELHFPEMVKNSFKRHKFTIDQHKRKIAEQWFLFFLQKGYLAGLTFFEEYVQSLHWNEEDGPLEIAYYQCSFCGENSIYTLSKTDEQEQREILNPADSLPD